MRSSVLLFLLAAGCSPDVSAVVGQAPPVGGGEGGAGGAPEIPPGCGDGQRAEAEPCDGEDLAGQDCVAFGFGKAEGLQCAVNCEFDISGCTPTCDGLAIETGEACDGALLGNTDCTAFGFEKPGGIACATDCNDFDTSGCTASCGNKKLELGEDCDGTDFGGQTCQDFDFSKPGNLTCLDCALGTASCVATCGDGEQEPGEACDDGDEESGDGCSASCELEVPAGGSCDDPIEVVLNSASTVSGSTWGGEDVAPSTVCSGSVSGEDNHVVAVTTPSAGFVTARLVPEGTAFDSVLYVQSVCGEALTTEVCSDFYQLGVSGTESGEVVSYYSDVGETYYVVIDSFLAGQGGDYQLALTLSPGGCMKPVKIELPDASGAAHVVGTTSAGKSNQQASCGGQQAKEVIYEVTPANGLIFSAVEFEPMTGFDTVLYAKSVCGNGTSDLACEDLEGDGGEAVEVVSGAGQSRLIIVDGGPSQSGKFAMCIAGSALSCE